jgi:hypothetical protein
MLITSSPEDDSQLIPRPFSNLELPIPAQFKRHSLAPRSARAFHGTRECGVMLMLFADARVGSCGRMRIQGVVREKAHLYSTL